MNDIMIDIETLGTCHNAVIKQIGACYFDRFTGEIGNQFNENVEIGSCLEKGLTITAGSIKFWLERTELVTFLARPIPLGSALGKFGSFVDKKSFIWSHATFDPIILASAYKKIGQGLPYSYRRLRDIRTLTDLAGIKYKKEEGVGDPKSHDALEDCIYQVGYCVKCFKKLRQSQDSKM